MGMMFEPATSAVNRFAATPALQGVDKLMGRGFDPNKSGSQSPELAPTKPAEGERTIPRALSELVTSGLMKPISRLAGKAVNKSLPTVDKIPLKDVSEAPKEVKEASTLSPSELDKRLGVKEPDPTALRMQRKMLRARFADDQQYVTHLGQRMNKSMLQDIKAQEFKDTYRRAEEIKHEITIAPKTASEATSEGEIFRILKKPGFQRDAVERLKLRNTAKAQGWTNQSGAVSPMFLSRLASMGVGATAGYQLDPENRIQGMVMGGLLGTAAPGALKLLLENRKALMTGATYKNLWKSINPAEKYDLTKPLEMIDKRFANGFTTARATWQLQNQLEKLVPEAKDRIEITRALDEGKRPIIPAHAEAYDLTKKFYEEFGEKGLESGVLKSLREHYATRVFGLNANKLLSFLDANPNIYGTTKSAFAKQRKSTLPLSVISDLVKEGKLPPEMLPQTQDIRDIVGIYGNSMSNAIENKKLIEGLKNLEGNGERMIMPAADAPRHYVSIDHPQLMSYKINPELAPSLKFIFDKSDPAIIGRGLLAFNVASKRSSVSFSGFHLHSLLSALVNALGGPHRYPEAIAKLTKDLRNQSPMLKMLREGGAGDLVDTAGRAGLKFSFSHGPMTAVEDISGVGKDIPQEGLASVEQFLKNKFDTIIPGTSTAVHAVRKASAWVDEMMWARAHAGMKLDLFSKEYEKLLLNNAKSGKLIAPDILAKHAASYVNDIFGGLDWYRIAQGVQNKIGRNIMLQLFSPSGRRAMQMLMFAPDWTLSTTRAVAKAFKIGEGTGVKGFVKPMTSTDLHRRYVAGAALSYVTLFDGINLAMSGHHVWENEDKTRIDMGDGRTMQFDKHSMEAMQWIFNPGKTAYGKLSPGIHEGIEQLMGVDYLSQTPQGRMAGPPIGNRVSHVAEKFVPFPLQNVDASAGGLKKFVASELGSPIYGMTRDERIMAKRKKDAAAGEKHR